MSFQSFENPAPVPRSLLPSVDVLINNNNGMSSCNGFTQSETATAWCGASVAVGFNDTGSEIRTILGTGGVSALGYSVSTNHGVAFSYVGAPMATSNPNQTTMGEPSLACADSVNFYYASVWSDNAEVRSGIAVARRLAERNRSPGVTPERRAPLIAVAASS